MGARPDYDAVATLLTREGNEEKSAEELAKEIVDGIFSALSRNFRQPSPPLEVGLVYNFPWFPQALSLVWQQGDLRWFMGRSSEYGWLTDREAQGPALRWRKLSPRATFVEPASDKYVVGDWVQLYGAKAHRYKVVATAGTTALMEGPRGTFTAFPFKELDKYFRFWRKKERNTDA